MFIIMTGLTSKQVSLMSSHADKEKILKMMDEQISTVWIKTVANYSSQWYNQGERI